MIDLETGDTAYTAAVWEVGCVVVDGVTGEIEQETAFFLNMSSPMQAKRTVSAATVEYLDENSPQWPKYNDAIIDDNDSIIAMQTLAVLLCTCDEVWCKGASFDFPILRGLFEDFGMSYPIQFRKERCMRVMLALYPDVPMLLDTSKTHGALYDAQAQMIHLQMLLAQFEEDTKISNAVRKAQG